MHRGEKTIVERLARVPATEFNKTIGEIAEPEKSQS